MRSLMIWVWLCAFAPHVAEAQLDPSVRWRTIRTEHFRVHFSDGLDSVARRAAGSAERAYARLATELAPPRGPVELVIADNYDISNGSANVFPSNRITIYARPTVDATSLRFLDDWIDLAVSHELTHVFHLDRSRGWWRLAQYVVGRAPTVFPGLYTPNWIAEGLAVFYETRLTGAGRVAGTDHEAIVDAAAADNTLPSLHALSAASPAWPLGSNVYVYGSLFLDQLAKTQGPASMRAFVDKTAGRTLPFLLNTNARAAFGVSFDSAYRAWTDALRQKALRVGSDTAVTDVSKRGWANQRIRWLDDNRLVYASGDARDVPALRELNVTTGATSFLARRNSLDATVQLPDGSRLFTQLDFADAYSLRSDLYRERDGSTTQLTHGARLMQVDARAGSVGAASVGAGNAAGSTAGTVVTAVAVQLLPGASRLVRLTIAGNDVAITPLTGASPDTIWSEPRWSHDGTRIAASRWRRGGLADIAILDAATGRLITTLGASRAVVVAPSWSAADSAIYFTSDRTGRSALYRGSVATGALHRVAESRTALAESELSPDGTRLATTHLRGDGVHIAITPVRAGTPADSTSVLAPSRADPLVVAGGAATNYSAWRTVLPTYWLPAAQQTDDNKPQYGFITGGNDVITRHSWAVQALYSPAHREPGLDASYSYAGLGNPLVGVSGSEVWDHFDLIDKKVILGQLARRKRFADAAVTFRRPTVRTSSNLTIGAEMEWREFRTEPAALYASLAPSLRRDYMYPAFFASAGFSNVTYPALAVSYEDGIQVAASVKTRWRADSASGTRSTAMIGVFSGYKAIDLGAYAHHVLAVRLAVGTEDAIAPSELKAGGTSGGSLSLIPGLALGDGRRTFAVRGFPSGAQRGNRAVATSVEYRFPIALPGSGLWDTPLFFRSVSGLLFGDSGAAWCDGTTVATAACPLGATQRSWMASAGAELDLDAAIEYDVPYRFRLGVAVPTMGRQFAKTSGASVFFALGLSF